MKLFELVDEIPVPSAEARTIKEFNKLITRDRGSKGDSQGRAKKRALQELAFVHWYCTFDTRFESLEEEERIASIANAVGLPEDWQVDSEVRMAVERYSDMLITESMPFVQSLREGITKIQHFIRHVEMIAVVEKVNKDADGEIESIETIEKLKYDPKNLQAIIEKAPSTLKALNEAKKEVEKELQDKFGGSSKKIRSMVSSFTDSTTIEGRI